MQTVLDDITDVRTDLNGLTIIVESATGNREGYLSVLDGGSRRITLLRVDARGGTNSD